MGLRSLGAYSALSLLLSSSLAWADTGASTTTLTIDPAATSGSTITASDENSRNNDVSTAFNAHVHSLPNTTNIGDAAAGDKNLCFDAADATDRCFRFDDTNNLVLVNSPTAGTYNQVATFSSTTGLTGLVRGDGTAALLGNSSVASSDITNGTIDVVDLTDTGTRADDKAFVADSASAGTWRSLPNCTDSGGNHLNYTQSTNSFSCGTSGSASPVSNIITISRTTAQGAGSASYTGMGFQSTALIAVCATGANLTHSLGFGDDDNDERSIDIRSTTLTTLGARFAACWDGTDGLTATLTSIGSDGFTLSWTANGTPPADCSCDVMGTDS